MKVILYGGKQHGSIIHRPDRNQWSSDVIILGKFQVVIHESESQACQTSKKFKRFLAHCQRLLDDPLLFQGPKYTRRKRPLQKHEPANPEEHGVIYVRNCLLQSKFKNKC